MVSVLILTAVSSKVPKECELLGCVVDVVVVRI